MALTFDTNRQNDVAIRLYGRAYASCTTDQKTQIDNAGARALNQIYRFGDYLDNNGLAAPDEWAFWLSDLATYEAAVYARQDMVPELQRKARESQATAVSSYSRSVSTGTSPADLAFDLLSLRRYITSRCNERDANRWPSFDLIDSAIKSAVTWAWNTAGWRFTTQVARITIAADATVSAATLGGTAITIDRVEDDHLTYEDGLGTCYLVDQERIIAERTVTDRAEGLPIFAYTLRTAASVQWLFAPEPDQEYTALAKVHVATPTMTSKATIDSAMALFPADMVPLVQDLAFARVLRDTGDREGRALLREAEERIQGEGPQFDTTTGKPETPVYNRTHGLGMRPHYFGSGHL